MRRTNNSELKSESVVLSNGTVESQAKAPEHLAMSVNDPVIASQAGDTNNGQPAQDALPPSDPSPTRPLDAVRAGIRETKNESRRANQEAANGGHRRLTIDVSSRSFQLEGGTGQPKSVPQEKFLAFGAKNLSETFRYKLFDQAWQPVNAFIDALPTTMTACFRPEVRLSPSVSFGLGDFTVSSEFECKTYETRVRRTDELELRASNIPGEVLAIVAFEIFRYLAAVNSPTIPTTLLKAIVEEAGLEPVAGVDAKQIDQRLEDRCRGYIRDINDSIWTAGLRFRYYKAYAVTLNALTEDEIEERRLLELAEAERKEEKKQRQAAKKARKKARK